MTRILADTGFLVALFHPADRLAPFARSYLRGHRHPLATVAPVIVETCFFLSGAEKAQLLDKGPPSSAHHRSAGSLGLYLCRRAVEAHSGEFDVVESAEWPNSVIMRFPATGS